MSQQMEQYYFYRLYSIDLDNTKHILRILKRYRRKDVRYCLLRDIVVSYCRPFSGNKGKKISTHTLNKKVVPKELCILHDELVEIRNQLFAHTDYTYRQPKVANWSTDSQKWIDLIALLEIFFNLVYFCLKILLHSYNKFINFRYSFVELVIVITTK